MSNTEKKSKEQTFVFRGTRFLVLVAILYGVLLFFDSGAVFISLRKAAAVLFRIVPILALVICFTGLLNYFLRPKQIVHHLGGESGARGWLWSMAAGVVSHGPMYVWYPLLDDLRRHGAREGLLVTFFYARAIKVPLLPMMIDYFGVTFTTVLSSYILVGALLQGMILQWLEDR
ncbi:MAG: permease [Thermodesulfobacteriota bacterium]